MELQLIAGTASSIFFTLSQMPMLLKVVRTRSIASYSRSHILMNNAANVIHWGYVASLPFGPIWFLHGFYTISMALMLLLYFRYEKRDTADRSTLQLPASENKKLIVDNGATNQAPNESSKEISDFHLRFAPNANPIYRVTGNPREAKRLQETVYLGAFMQHLLGESEQNFNEWLPAIVDERFSDWRTAKADRKSRLPEAVHLESSNEAAEVWAPNTATMGWRHYHPSKSRAGACISLAGSAH